jgi:hypothetical protein
MDLDAQQGLVRHGRTARRCAGSPSTSTSPPGYRSTPPTAALCSKPTSCCATAPAAGADVASLRPHVETHRPATALGRRAVRVDALAAAHHPDLGRTQLRLWHRPRLRRAYRQHRAGHHHVHQSRPASRRHRPRRRAPPARGHPSTNSASAADISTDVRVFKPTQNHNHDSAPEVPIYRSAVRPSVLSTTLLRMHPWRWSRLGLSPLT